MKILIAYYSRTGNNRKIASLLKEVMGENPDVETELESITDLKNRNGAVGYVLGGRDAARKKGTHIRTPELDVAGFDTVVVGGPVWAWTVCPAVRTYCSEYGRKAERVAFFCTMGGSGDNRTFQEMEKLCGSSPVAAMSLTDGVIKKGGDDLTEKLKEFARKILG